LLVELIVEIFVGLYIRFFVEKELIIMLRTRHEKTGFFCNRFSMIK